MILATLLTVKDQQAASNDMRLPFKWFIQISYIPVDATGLPKSRPQRQICLDCDTAFTLLHPMIR